MPASSKHSRTAAMRKASPPAGMAVLGARGGVVEVGDELRGARLAILGIDRAAGEHGRAR